MPKYCDVKPILHLLADKDLLDTVNVGAVLQALQHGLYNGEVAPVVHAHWERHFKRSGVYEDLWLYCTNCNSRTSEEYAPYWWSYCPYCGAKMDEKEGNI